MLALMKVPCVARGAASTPALPSSAATATLAAGFSPWGCVVVIIWLYPQGFLGVTPRYYY